MSNPIAAIKIERYTPIIVLIAGLAVVNVGFVGSTGWSRLAWNLVGYLCLYLVYRIGKLTLDDVALNPVNFRSGLKLAFGVIAIIAVIFSLGYLLYPSLYNDTRYKHSLATILYASIILLPLKTVLLEELAFRGLLFGLLTKLGIRTIYSIVISSVCFGLWHIFSSFDLYASNFSNYSMPLKLTTAVAVILFTSIAGAFLSVLRLRSKSLLAPILVHWFVNGFAMILVSLS